MKANRKKLLKFGIQAVINLLTAALAVLGANATAIQ